MPPAPAPATPANAGIHAYRRAPVAAGALGAPTAGAGAAEGAGAVGGHDDGPGLLDAVEIQGQRDSQLDGLRQLETIRLGRAQRPASLAPPARVEKLHGALPTLCTTDLDPENLLGGHSRSWLVKAGLDPSRNSSESGQREAEASRGVLDLTFPGPADAAPAGTRRNRDSSAVRRIE